MEEISAQYMEFLKANYSDAAAKIDMLTKQEPSGKTPDELQKSAAEIELRVKTLTDDPERLQRYHKWEKVPSIIRDRYAGKVPDDILEAAANDEIYTLRVLEYRSDIKRAQDARILAQEYQDKMPFEIAGTAGAAVFIAAMASGYSENAGTELAMQRLARDGLLNEKAAIMADANLDEKEKQRRLDEWFNKWLASREATAATIKKDWAENQPEKLLIHILSNYNRGKIDKETLMPQLREYTDKIRNESRQDKLLEYMQQKNIQAKIGHFKDEIRDVLAEVVLNQVLPAQKAKDLAYELNENAKKYPQNSAEKQNIAPKVLKRENQREA